MRNWISWKFLVRWGGMLGLAAAILLQVVRSSGEPYGRAIVHLSEVGVSLWLDEVEHTVESLDEIPVVFEVRPGRHEIRLVRGDVTQDEQRFEVGGAEEVVLCLWKGNREQRAAAKSARLDLVYGRGRMEEGLAGARGGLGRVTIEPAARVCGSEERGSTEVVDVWFDE